MNSVAEGPAATTKTCLLLHWDATFEYEEFHKCKDLNRGKFTSNLESFSEVSGDHLVHICFIFSLRQLPKFLLTFPASKQQSQG